ncbi:hypothetical protein LEMLEM_LOCUS26178, partial [Lemmus lemmus]
MCAAVKESPKATGLKKSQLGHREVITVQIQDQRSPRVRKTLRSKGDAERCRGARQKLRRTCKCLNSP